MTSKGILTVALSAIGAAVVFAQAEPPRLPPPAPNAPAPSLQSAADPGYAALIATCKTPPPAAEAARAAVPRRGGGAPDAVRRRRRASGTTPSRKFPASSPPDRSGRSVAAGGQQRRRHHRPERRRPAARAEPQQRRAEARQERQDVGRLLGHAHRRRAVDEQEGRRCSSSSAGCTQRSTQLTPKRRMLADKLPTAIRSTASAA